MLREQLAQGNDRNQKLEQEKEEQSDYYAELLLEAQQQPQQMEKVKRFHEIPFNIRPRRQDSSSSIVILSSTPAVTFNHSTSQIEYENNTNGNFSKISSTTCISCNVRNDIRKSRSSFVLNIVEHEKDNELLNVNSFPARDNFSLGLLDEEDSSEHTFESIKQVIIFLSLDNYLILRYCYFFNTCFL